MTGVDDTVHLAFGFDERMELPFLVAADSIRRRLAPGRHAVFHVLHTDPLRHCADYRARIASDPNAAETCTFRFHEVRNPLAGLWMRNGVSAATYLRYLVPDLLHDVDRVLWIDCDTVALRDIGALYNADLGGCAVAAVPNYSVAGAMLANGWLVGEEPNVWPVGRYIAEVVGLRAPTDYFNAGVLVMDLAQFRSRDLMDRCRDFTFRTDDIRVFNDQDALNHVIAGAFARLDARWNVQTSRKPEDFAKADNAAVEAASLWQSDPWILHYTGPGKPWLGNLSSSVRDRDYWQEARACPMLPELLDLYLASATREGLARLFSPRELLATGKPKLDEAALLRCADDFRGQPAVASALRALLAGLDAWTDAGALDIAATRFRRRGGEPVGDAVAFALAGSHGHLVYGPYVGLPAGDYVATFDFALGDAQPANGGRIVIEVGSDLGAFRAQRNLMRKTVATAQERTLQFSLDGSEIAVEFRIFVTGYRGGRLTFNGVRLQRQPTGTVSRSDNDNLTAWRRVLRRLRRSAS